MAARFRIETIGLLVAFAAATLLIAAWGWNGFAINRADHDHEQAVANHPAWFGCYGTGNLRVSIGRQGLSMPGTGIMFTKATVSSDKRGSFLYFEPAINIAKEETGGSWQVHRDEKTYMIQKFYFSPSSKPDFLVLAGGSEDGTKLRKLPNCTGLT